MKLILFNVCRNIILFECQTGDLLIKSAWENVFNRRQRLTVTEYKATVWPKPFEWNREDETIRKQSIGLLAQSNKSETKGFSVQDLSEKFNHGGLCALSQECVTKFCSA